jgi:acyl dehydratase
MSAQESPASPGIDTDVQGLFALTGTELGHTEWRVMTQDEVDRFADLTDDHNFIHVDPVRAKETMFGGTIAHGFLTVSLLAPISQGLLRVTGASTSINYGTDKIRFPAPLPVGAQYRGSGTITEVTEIKGGVQVKATFTVEVKDAPRPCLVAECLSRYYA